MIPDIDNLKKSLQIDAISLGIPSGAAKIFIKKALNDAEKSIKNKSIVTTKDVQRAVHKELKKYNADLAYVYQNRDKII